MASSLLCFGCCLTSEDNKSTYLIGLRVRGFKEIGIKTLAQRLVHGKCFKILLLLSPRAFPYTVMGRGGANRRHSCPQGSDNTLRGRIFLRRDTEVYLTKLRLL